MPTTTIPLATLIASEMWKADSFVATKTTRESAAHPMVALSHLVEYPKHAFSYIGLEHVASHTGDLLGFGPRVGTEVLSRSKVFRSGDILYGRLRPYLNKVFVAAPPAHEGICSGEFFVLVPDVAQVQPVLLRALLASKFVRESIAGLHTGSALPRLQLDDLLRVRLPIPPPEQQASIVAALQQLATVRLRARSLLDEQPDLAEQELRDALTLGRPFDLDRVVPSAKSDATVCELPPGYAAPGGRKQSARGGALF